MTGQNQYNLASTLTSHRTRRRRSLPLAHSARFGPGSAATCGAVLLVAGSFALAAILAALPRGLSMLTTSALTGGAWLSIVLGLTLPNRDEPAGMELAGRLGVFRQRLDAAGDNPSRHDLERLLALASELRLPGDEIVDEMARIRASLGALTLREALSAGAWPSAVSPDPLLTGDACHFTSPVRFGRRRADQYGHLILTRMWLKFRGALDVSFAWSEVVSVERVDRELIVTLQDCRRMLRFSCQTYDEAARGGVIASELARLAAARGGAAGVLGSPYETI